MSSRVEISSQQYPHENQCCPPGNEGTSQLSEMLSDIEPDAEPRPVADAITGARAGEVPSQWQMSANASLHLARLPRKVSLALYETLRSRVFRQLGGDKGGPAEKPIVPAANSPRLLCAAVLLSHFVLRTMTTSVTSLPARQ